MNRAILAAGVQRFIREHNGRDLDRLLFKKSPFPGVSSKELAEQIESRKKCEKKLPSWFAAEAIYYPPKLSVEQASSELTAQYKSRLATGDSVIDLTGGMGVDSLAFATRATKVFHIELSSSLSEIAAYNDAILGSNNAEFLNGDGIAYLTGTKDAFGTIYCDPSRRAGSSKVFRLADCLPDVTAHLGLFLQKAGRTLIKTSPLLDLSAGISELRHVSEIHVVSVKNECKELLWTCSPEANGEARITCAALGGDTDKELSFFPSEEVSAVIDRYSAPLRYLYEPDAALLKAGCFKLIALRYGVDKLERHSHLYTSEKLVENFAGRIFRVENVLSYKEFSTVNAVAKANVVSRNFPLTPEALRKKHRIADGGDDFLVFTTTEKDRLTVIHARKVK